jgi:hypothetical protein
VHDWASFQALLTWIHDNGWPAFFNWLHGGLAGCPPPHFGGGAGGDE